MLKIHAISKTEYKAKLTGKILDYGYGDSPYGKVLMALIDGQVCFLGFFEDGHSDIVLNALKNTYPHLSLNHDNDRIAGLVKNIFRNSDHQHGLFDLVVTGTDFQVAVWKTLLKLTAGEVKSYQQIAEIIGRPQATRAVASAIAKNPISYLIPCHRVIRKSGKFHKYRWGADRKKQLLENERLM